MSFITQIYNIAIANGFTKTENQLTTKISEIMANDLGCISNMTDTFTYLNSFGYTENYTAFENKYWNFFGTRPKGR